MSKLYNEDETYTPLATEIGDRIWRLCREILSEFPDIPVWEIENVLHGGVLDAALSERIGRQRKGNR